MSEAVRNGEVQSAWLHTIATSPATPRPLSPSKPSGRLTAWPPDRLTCNRCGFAVTSRPWGCKNPCPNCGTVYPLGDCSD